MNAKNGGSIKPRNATHLSDWLIGRMTNTENLDKSLSVGSKKRLSNYRTNLSISRGVNHPGFDDKVVDVIKEYSKINVDDEINYLNHLKDSDGYSFSRNLKIYSKIDESMRLFNAPDYTSFRWNRNYQGAVKKMKEEFSQFHLTPLVYTCDEDIRLALPKENTHSGFYYILSGKRSKGENIQGIFDKFQTKVSQALEEGSFNTPIMIAFRTQASGEYDDNGRRTGKCKHKVRVVSMIDLLWVIAEFMFMKPLQSKLSTSEFYAGGKRDEEISTYLINWRRKYSKFISLDYSSFDQSISGWLLRDAYDIISCAFDMTDEQRRLWDVLVNSAVDKEFLLSEGNLWSHRGMPSGLPSTQIGDTVVNRLIALTYFNSIGESFEMMAMGDDNIIYTNGNVHLVDFASYVRKNFGMEVKTDDKSCEGVSSDDPKFLSRYWTIGGTWRHPNLLLSRLAFPERFRDYTRDEVTPELVVWGYILAYPRGMSQLIDVSRFSSEHPLVRLSVLDRVDSRYIPGVLAYVKEYLKDN